jgi:hypothetical protein
VTGLVQAKSLPNSSGPVPSRRNSGLSLPWGALSPGDSLQWGRGGGVGGGWGVGERAAAAWRRQLHAAWRCARLTKPSAELSCKAKVPASTAPGITTYPHTGAAAAAAAPEHSQRTSAAGAAAGPGHRPTCR